ncbi:hypothetical protein GYMLUDRAFT_78193 [Collybiopsis luxurians FD-317 M1]|uniref:Cytochrome P450 n=1 Tax=Collybiopsis luxurians FD-317 M1 TaxID=944289 RepID=A0A0D0AML0_9AGAR|nr:hypothetical protein GYMLUDRAFT_78193 [Collybiopsis luxurians FD-317 M1]
MVIKLIPILLLLAAVTLFFAFRRPSHEGGKLPPGPHLLQIPVLRWSGLCPLHRPYPKFREWAKQYGPVFSLKLGSQDIIVLNTAQAVNDLLNTRSKIYSSRAPPHVAYDIMSDGQRLVFLSYDKEWKASRIQFEFALRNIQELESRVTIFDLMNHGYASLSPKFSVPASIHAEVPDTHWFALVRQYIYDVLANFAHVGQPGNYLADIFPILRKLPDFLAPWRAAGRKMHEWEMELWGGILESGKKLLSAGTANTYVNTYLRKRSERGHPLDVPGVGLTDDGKISVFACIKETLRRRPPTIMSIPHLADDECEGMFIPDGSTVIGNVWTIHLDPAVHPNPMAFQPERFLPTDGQAIQWGSGPEARDWDHLNIIVLSRLIWAINFTAPVDPTAGKPKIPDINNEEGIYTSGFVSVPRIYPVSFKPRSKGREYIIRKAYEEAQSAWDLLGLEKDIN